jgi:hypothetical protein
MENKLQKFLIASIFALTGCQVAVKSFEADPEFVCVPGESELNWEVASRSTVNITLSVEDTDSTPPLLSEFPISTNAPVGSREITVPEGRTEFRLLARGGGDNDSATTTVTGLGSETLTNLLTFDPDCAADGSVNGWTSVDLTGYDDAIRPRGVTNTSDRIVTITHAGISRPLAPRETSSAWNGTALGGRWSVTAMLLSRTPRGAEMVTESCSPTVGPGGSVAPTPGDATRTIRLEALSASVAFGCDGP